MPFLVRVGSVLGAVTFSGLAGFSYTSSVLVIAWRATTVVVDRRESELE
jgi:hypothetical protein